MSLKKKIISGIATISLVGALVGGATLAMFTDTETTTGTFAAGKVDLSVGTANTQVTIPCMAPGDEGSFEITVSNPACLDLFYKVTPSLTGDLASGATPLTVSVSGGDAIRALAANGASQVITVNYALPLAADNSYSLDTANLTLTFDAVQADNNTQASAFNGVTVLDAEDPEL